METVKKHLISIVCGGVVLLALLLSYFPMSGFFSDLDSRLKQSEQELSKVKQAANVTVQFPTADPFNPGPSVFPSERVYDAASRVVDQIVDASTNMVQQVVSLNAEGKQLLVRGALPAGADLGVFKDRYPVALAQFPPLLRAGLPVSDDEVTTAMPKPADAPDAATGQPAAPPDPAMMRRRGAPWLEGERMAIRRGAMINRAVAGTEESDERARMRDKLALERAGKIAMYITPDLAGGGSGNVIAGATSSFDRHAGIPAPQDPRQPELQDVWAAQISLWIQQDVVNAIVDSNKESKAVETSVVKRLVAIEIPKEYITKSGPVTITDIRSEGPVRAMARPLVFGRGPAAAAAAQPTDANTPAVPLSPLVRDFTWSPTGRICNKDYDVMHFAVTVDVDAARYGEFLANLQNDRCITVLSVDMRGVDLEDVQRQGYLYGKGPVVQLVIKCEALFFRQWTVIGDKNNPGPMPDAVRDLLNIPKTSAVRTGATGLIRGNR